MEARPTDWGFSGFLKTRWPLSYFVAPRPRQQTGMQHNMGFASQAKKGHLLLFKMLEELVPDR